MTQTQTKAQLRIELLHLMVLRRQRARAYGPLDAVAAQLRDLILDRTARLNAAGARG